MMRLAAMAAPALQEEIARRFNTRKNERFFVAGSTHEGEEKIIIDVYEELLKHYPDFKLIIVPRHIERTKRYSWPFDNRQILTMS